mmetsp:Transcript_22121/g.29174  ORF Transcript_22121/g.29174 Transcript_22121/m.29174 type:complete len:93 (+) Transcript_22121:832-1110(+)
MLQWAESHKKQTKETKPRKTRLETWNPEAVQYHSKKQQVSLRPMRCEKQTKVSLHWIFCEERQEGEEIAEGNPKMPHSNRHKKQTPTTPQPS